MRAVLLSAAGTVTKKPAGVGVGVGVGSGGKGVGTGKGGRVG